MILHVRMLIIEMNSYAADSLHIYSHKILFHLGGWSSTNGTEAGTQRVDLTSAHPKLSAGSICRAYTTPERACEHVQSVQKTRTFAKEQCSSACVQGHPMNTNTFSCWVLFGCLASLWWMNIQYLSPRSALRGSCF